MTSSTDTDRWQRLQAAFDEAMALPEAGRAALLARLGATDPELASQLAGLLTSAERRTDAAAAVLGAAAAAALTAEHAALPADAMVGPYRIVRLIGRGGMGEVYEAEQAQPVRRRVALKFINAGISDPQVLARFDSERQALALMDHPAIATVHDAGATASGRPYFVMELVDGEPIDLWCERHNPGLRARIELAVQVCRGVQHAHLKGVIHRDLKPSNLLVAALDGRAQPKIIDFGIARATSTPQLDATRLTRIGQLIGTPRYMSPEQFRSQGVDVDTRSDVYALGTVIYELLVGEHPLNVATLDQPGDDGYRHQLLEVEPLAPSRRLRAATRSTGIARQRSTATLPPSGALRGDLDWILLKCLEKDRERRYATAGELADDLERYLRHEPVAAGPPTLRYRARKFVRRHRAASIAAVLVLLSLLAGLTVAWSGVVRARAAESQALQQAATAREVSEFLVGLFAASDPARKQLQNVSARALLDNGAAQIDQRLNDQPRTKAQLLTTIGRVYESVGLPSNARPILERAVQLFDQSASDPLELAHALNSLSTVQRRLNDPAAALLTAERSLDIRRRVAGEQHELTGRSWSVVGTSRIRAGDLKGAEAALIKAHDIAAAAAPGTATHSAAAYNLAGLYYELGRLRDALPLVEESLRIQQAIDPDAADIGDQYDGLGSLRFSLGDYEASERDLGRALEHRRKVYGNDHYVVSESLGNIALLHLTTRQYQSAAALAREAIATAQRAGTNASAVSSGQNFEVLAVALAHLNDFAAARAAVKEAQVLRSQLPATHPQASLGQLALARVESANGNLDQARTLFEAVLAHRVPLLGTSHLDNIAVYADLARLETAAMRPDAAEAQYRQVLAAGEQADLLKHPMVLDALSGYVALLRDSRREAEAGALQARL